MAEGESESPSVSQKNCTQPSKKETEDEILTDMKGWLMKRTKISHKWKKQWFILKNTDLFYGNTEQKASKRIPLMSAVIAESAIDKKDNCFRIKPKDKTRVYYMYADDEATQHNWMQAICFAKAAGSLGDQSQACVIQ